jgi:hypothetical protein
MPKRYPGEFRRRVLAVLEAGKTVAEVAEDLAHERLAVPLVAQGQAGRRESYLLGSQFDAIARRA